MKSGWLVFERSDEVISVLYNGPDKAKARDKAAKALADGKAEVFVTRLRDVVKLSPGSMLSVLPRNAF